MPERKKERSFIPQVTIGKQVMYHYGLTETWIGVNQIILKDIEELSVSASPMNIFQVEPLAGAFQHYARLFPTLKGRQEVLINPLKRKTTGLTLSQSMERIHPTPSSQADP